MRQRISDQFTDRYNQAKKLQAELETIEAAQPPAQDISLLDELPYLAGAFDSAPDNLKAKLYAAFDVQVLYRAHKKQATITQTTPRIVSALAADPRTDNDTRYGNLTHIPLHRGKLPRSFPACADIGSCGLRGGLDWLSRQQAK